MKARPMFRCMLAMSALFVPMPSSSACGLAWSPTIGDALKDATLTRRLAVVVFTGSDWSANGLKLDETVFMNAEFADRFMKHFALVNADFPQRKQPAPEILAANTAWATRLGIKAWPTLVALRPDGSEFARFEYQGQSVSEVTAVIDGWHRRFSSQPQS